MKPIRRAQLITPFGIGAIVNFPGDESLMICGLEKWQDLYASTVFGIDGAQTELRNVCRIEESRFTRKLEINELREPPVYGELGAFKIPAVRFPQVHICTHFQCGYLFRVGLQVPNPGNCPRCQQQGKSIRLIPVRFVAICNSGHIDDFPFLKWVHRNNKQQCAAQISDLRLKQTGGSSSFANVKVCCDSCYSEEPLKHAFNPTTLNNVQGCRGFKPWLGLAPDGTEYIEDGCAEQVTAVQKGASNVYFPIVESSIYIPTTFQPMAAQGEHAAPRVSAATEYFLSRKEGELNPGNLVVNLDGQPTYRANFNFHGFPFNRIQWLEALFNSEFIDTRTQNFGGNCEYFLNTGEPLFHEDKEPLISELKRSITTVTGLDWDTGDQVQGLVQPQEQNQIQPVQNEFTYRFFEFSSFLRQQSVKETELSYKRNSREKYSDGSKIRQVCEAVIQIDHLRETRALCGFLRGSGQFQNYRSARDILSAYPQNAWLPASKNTGEGLFFKFDEEMFDQFCTSHNENLRVQNGINSIRRKLAENGGWIHEIMDIGSLLLHTLSHILIEELCYSCGYSSSSLRERLYYSRDYAHPMIGLLIYTAAPDSEGSMGGLVRMGEPDLLEEVFENAIQKARWCSNDPICIQTTGTENLSACHACCLIGETSCELGNRYLDRALLVGMPQIGDTPSWNGFFNT